MGDKLILAIALTISLNLSTFLLTMRYFVDRCFTDWKFLYSVVAPTTRVLHQCLLSFLKLFVSFVILYIRFIQLSKVFSI